MPTPAPGFMVGGAAGPQSGDLTSLLLSLLGPEGADMAAASGAMPAAAAAPAPTATPAQQPGTPTTPAPATPPGGFGQDQFLQAMMGVKALAPSPAPAPQAGTVASSRANASAINPAMFAAMQQMMQPAGRAVPNLGQLIAGR